MKNLLVFIFLLMSVLANAQQTSFALKADGNTPFVLIVDGVIVNQTFSLYVNAKNLTVNNHYFKVVFQNSAFEELVGNIDLKSNTFAELVLAEKRLGKEWNSESIIAENAIFVIVKDRLKTNPNNLEESTPAVITSRPVELANNKVVFTSVAQNNVVPIINQAPNILQEENHKIDLNLQYNKKPSAQKIVIASQHQEVRKELETKLVEATYLPTNSIENLDKNNCQQPLTETNFLNAFNLINSKLYNDGKMEIAKQIAENNCLKANQIKRIVDVFAYDDAKLDFAKYAYKFCFDKENYSLIYTSFSLKNVAEELVKYTNQQ